MRGGPPRPQPKLDVPLFLRERDFDEKFLLLTSLMTKKSSFFGTLKKGLKMAVFGGLRKGSKNRHFLVFFYSCWVLLILMRLRSIKWRILCVRKFFVACGDVNFSSRCRFFVIFQSFFDPSKRPPKWPKNGSPSWSLWEHQNDHDKHTCEVDKLLSVCSSWLFCSLLTDFHISMSTCLWELVHVTGGRVAA
jgi:hypothetical protein